MKLELYIKYVLYFVPSSAKTIQFEIYLDSEGYVSNSNSGNKITFKVIRKKGKK